MKKLLVLITLLPFLAFAQDAEQPVATKPYQPKNEIGLSVGPVLESKSNFKTHFAYMGYKSTLSYLRNFGKTQAGISFDAGEGSSHQFFYLSPALFANRKFNAGNTYFYAGVSVGYFYSERNTLNRSYTFNLERGYTFGLQTGVVLPLGKHLAFTSEVAIRSTQVWFNTISYVPPEIYSHGTVEGYYIEYVDTDFSLHIPFTIGLRYRF